MICSRNVTSGSIAKIKCKALWAIIIGLYVSQTLTRWPNVGRSLAVLWSKNNWYWTFLIPFLKSVICALQANVNLLTSTFTFVVVLYWNTQVSTYLAGKKPRLLFNDVRFKIDPLALIYVDIIRMSFRIQWVFSVTGVSVGQADTVSLAYVGQSCGRCFSVIGPFHEDINIMSVC